MPPSGIGSAPAHRSSIAAAHRCRAATQRRPSAARRSQLGGPPPLTPLRSWVARLQKRFPLIQIVALVAVFVFGVLTLPGLGTWVSIRSILVLAALTGLASFGQTLLILMGGFDLSVSGFIVAGGLMVTALATKYHIDFATALVLALSAAGVLGSFAGYICHRFRINPLVVTLAMGSIVIGFVKVQIGEQSRHPPDWITHARACRWRRPSASASRRRSRSGSWWRRCSRSFLHRTAPGPRTCSRPAPTRARPSTR